MSEVAWGFPPVIDEHSQVLVLGSLPGRRSLAERQYYALPQNAFWPIMGRLFGAGPELPYAERLDRLLTGRMALWDVLAASERPGSLDANIVVSTAQCNDFVGLFRAFPGIHTVCFNGQKAAQLFRRRVEPLLADVASDLSYRILPSTSPAHASMRFEEKLSHWSVVKTSQDRAD